MIEQDLPNTNESATVLILQNFLELNKALIPFFCQSFCCFNLSFDKTDLNNIVKKE